MWTEPKLLVGHHQVDKYAYFEIPNVEDRQGQRIFEKVVVAIQIQ